MCTQIYQKPYFKIFYTEKSKDINYLSKKTTFYTNQFGTADEEKII